MSIISAISNVNSILGFQDVFNTPDITPAAMLDAIKRWYQLYYDSADYASQHGCEDSDDSQKVPFVIVDTVTRATFQEYEVRLDTPTETTDSKAEKRTEDLVKVLNIVLPEMLQGLCIGGEGFLKPGIDNGHVYVQFVDRLSYMVLARDFMGNPTDVVLTDEVKRDRFFYTLFERRQREGARTLVTSKLYRSESAGSIGEEVYNLEDIYPGVQPEAYLNDENLGLIYVRLPIKNCVGNHKDGVSLYASAVKKIEQLYVHEQRTNNEYELTEPHMIASQDVFPTDAKGEPIGDVPKYLLGLDDDPSRTGVNIYNPTPHQTELEGRENQLLRHVENLVGLRRGILSHVDSEDKTATEVLASTTRYANLLSSLQDLITESVDSLIMTIQNLIAQFDSAGGNVYGVKIDWGNGVLYDEDKDFQRLFELTGANYIKPEFIVGWQFGEATSTDEDLMEIRKKYMPTSTSATANSFSLNDFFTGEDAPEQAVTENADTQTD